MYCISHPDIITNIVRQLHICVLTPTDYKAILRISVTWYKIAKNAQYERDHMNAIATIMSRNREKNWNFPMMIPYLTSELIEYYFCINGIFDDDKIIKSFNGISHDREYLIKTFYEYISNSKWLTHDLIINNITRLNRSLLYKNPCYTINLHDLSQQLHDLSQQLHDLSQQLHDLSQQLHDLSQQLHDLSQQLDMGNKEYTYSYHESLYLNPNFTIEWIETRYPRDIHGWQVRSIIDDKVVNVDDLVGDDIEDVNGNFILDRYDRADLDLWDDVISQPMLSSDMYEKYKPQFKNGMRDWFQHASLSREFALKYIKTHEAVIANKAVTCDLIEEFLPVIKTTHPNWEIYLSRNPNITIEFINAHPEIVLSTYEIMLHCRDIAVLERYFFSMLGLLWW